MRTEAFLGRDQVAAVFDVQPVGIGPMLVHAHIGIGPVIVHLRTEKVAADAPHVFVFAGGFQVLVAHEDVVDVLHLEAEVIQPGAGVVHAEERVVVDVVVAGIDAAELTEDVGLLAAVDVVRPHQPQHVTEPLHGFLVLRRAHDGVPDTLHRRRPLLEPDQFPRPVQRRGAGVDRLTRHRNGSDRCDAMHNFDGVTVRFGHPHALAAAGFVDVLDA